MNFYFAPLEGITGYLYRNAHHTLYPSIDKYFSPFIVANQQDTFKSREINDILPENNQGVFLVPQLLTNSAKDFIYTSKKINLLGHEEINLNLGCPSGTVVAKHRGAGFLAKKDALNTFLEEIFTASITKISIKTRIGKDDPEEFYELIEIFNQYPLEELIIHPRIQTDYYKNKPNLAVFKDALALSKNPVCYNGDINTFSEYKELLDKFPEVKTIMIGRGLITNPCLVKEIRTGEKLDKIKLKLFHDKILEDYQRVLSGDRNVLFKMKEIWFYLIPSFTNNAKYAKKIRKAERIVEYKAVVEGLFEEQEIEIG